MNRENRKVKIFVGNGTPMIAKKVNRNEKCGCGSGLKAKHCCGCNTKYFDSGPAKTVKSQDDIEEVKRKLQSQYNKEL